MGDKDAYNKFNFLESAAEIKIVSTQDPYCLTVSPGYKSNLHAKTLAVNGCFPTKENVISKKYPYSVDFVFYSKSGSGASEKLLKVIEHLQWDKMEKKGFIRKD